MMIRRDNVVLSSLFDWHLSDTDMTCLLPSLISSPGQEYFHYIYSGVSILDIINFGSNFSLECFKHGAQTLRDVKLKSVLLVLGAGGAVLYYYSKLRPVSPGHDTGRSGEVMVHQWPGQSIWEWLFAEELVQDPSLFYDSHNLSSYYFGPEPDLYPRGVVQLHEYPGSSHDADAEDSDDYSLNCVSLYPSPVKFLRRPLSANTRAKYTQTPVTSHLIHDESQSPVQISNPCPNCVKGTCRLKRHQLPLPGTSSSSSSCYSGSPLYRIKTSTPEQTEEELTLQRTMNYNKLLRRHYQLGLDPRMSGDGCEEEQSVSYGMSRDASMSSLAEFSSISVSNSMMDIVRDARDVRRLIREVSLDSQDSDLDLELESREVSRRRSGVGVFCDQMSKLIENCEASNNNEDDAVDNTGDNNNDAKDELVRDTSVPDFNLIQKKTCITRRLWKLTGFSEHESVNFSETSDAENGSMEWDSPVHQAWGSPSLSSKLEWDNEFSANDAASETGVDDDDRGASWLRALDSFSVSSRPGSRRSSTGSEYRYMTRYPPSGRSSVDKESVISKLSEADISAMLASSSKSSNVHLNGISRSKSGSYISGSECAAGWEDDSPVSSINANISQMNTSLTSLESGFQDCEGSMTSSLSSINNSITSPQSNILLAPAPLSPVKECKEPRSPAKNIPSGGRNKVVF